LRKIREAPCEICDKPDNLEVVRGVLGHRSCSPKLWRGQQEKSAASLPSRRRRGPRTRPPAPPPPQRSSPTLTATATVPPQVSAAGQCARTPTAGPRPPTSPPNSSTRL